MRLFSREIRATLGNRRNRRLPAREVFTRVYAEQMWGSGPGGFYSGPGSDREAAQPYADFVLDFITRNGIRSVVDLGCGDFRVGRMIARDSITYIGVDVVEPLIEDNIRQYGSDTIHFACLDISADRLPDGDLCLVREVFQHVSNAEISATLAKLRQYRYVLFTDVQPDMADGYKINKDKVHGASSRILHKSFLRLDAPPFNVKNIEMVFETSPPGFRSIPPYDYGFKLRTFLIKRLPSEPGLAESFNA
nr:class I SAM-dependent methyltransferase [uncultured Rhodopila sp.]